MLSNLLGRTAVILPALKVNRVGELGVGFGTTMFIGIVLFVIVFIFISLKDKPGVLIIVAVVIAAVAFYFFGDQIVEIVNELRWEAAG